MDHICQEWDCQEVATSAELVTALEGEPYYLFYCEKHKPEHERYLQIFRNA